MRDYAKTENMHCWHRHPVLGDPSFDTFEKRGETVHVSQPPYEWAVNGSLFRDPKDGALYVYAGLYPYGYALDAEHPAHFAIYRSDDEGGHWTCPGPGFEHGFVFQGHTLPADITPDVVITYDEVTDMYWMAYDWLVSGASWATVHAPDCPDTDSGAALAWSKHPAGPFTRLPDPCFSNLHSHGKLGRFTRGYGTTLLKRKDDWICLILCDSGSRFSWGLACITAKTPEGPWSEPHILLSVDRTEYYPAPVEFFPCFVVGDMIYAPATSVAKSRNYQAVFTANMEDAHLDTAWQLSADGNVWHSRNLADETHGLWGQTLHGFVHDGILNVVYPSKDSRDFGTLSLAARLWDTPFSDHFTLSGHGGPSLSPLYTAYLDFTLEAEFTYTGAVAFAFGYQGILGPDIAASDAIPAREALSCYHALKLFEDGRYQLISVDGDAQEIIHAQGYSPEKIASLRLDCRDGKTLASVNGCPCISAELEITAAHPLALIAHKFSLIRCTRFTVFGDEHPCTLRYNALDALLGAGQLASDWRTEDTLMFQSGNARLGKGDVFAKWNVTGSRMDLFAPQSPLLGVMSVWIDGIYCASVDLHADDSIPSACVFTVTVPHSRHSVMVKPKQGAIAVDVIVVETAIPCGVS